MGASVVFFMVLFMFLLIVNKSRQLFGRDAQRQLQDVAVEVDFQGVQVRQGFHHTVFITVFVLIALEFGHGDETAGNLVDVFSGFG